MGRLRSYIVHPLLEQSCSGVGSCHLCNPFFCRIFQGLDRKNRLGDNCQILAVRRDNCQIGQLSYRTTVSEDNCRIRQLSVRTTVSGDNCQWRQLSVGTTVIGPTVSTPWTTVRGNCQSYEKSSNCTQCLSLSPFHKPLPPGPDPIGEKNRPRRRRADDK